MLKLSFRVGSNISQHIWRIMQSLKFLTKTQKKWMLPLFASLSLNQAKFHMHMFPNLPKMRRLTNYYWKPSIKCQDGNLQKMRVASNSNRNLNLLLGVGDASKGNSTQHFAPMELGRF